jgi:hypothetical protein
LQVQLEARKRKDDRDGKASTPLNFKMHLYKIHKGKGKWASMVSELFNMNQLKGHFLKKSSKYVRDNIYTAPTLGHIIDLKHGINLSGLDALRIEVIGVPNT